jgi:hypothetical protein
MNDLIEASCLNSAGAFQLVSGKPKEARSFFVKALSLIRDTLNCSESGPKYSSHLNLSVIRLCNRGKDANNLPSYVQSDCFICTQPLLIDISDTDTLCEHIVTLSSVVILYNIALCHHSEGLHGQTKEIRRALFLYKNCTVLLRQFSDTTTCAVQIMLMNNLASCHYELGDFFGAYVKLRQMVPIINTCGENCEFILSGVMNDLVFNAMNISNQTIMSARAA